jgi:hypothetical protein
MRCIEKKFELRGESRKWEEYKGYDGDRPLVVELWLYRVADDLSALTFQEWDPSLSTDDVTPVTTGTLGLPPHGSESSTTRHGGSWRPSYTRIDSEKTSGCG